MYKPVDAKSTCEGTLNKSARSWLRTSETHISEGAVSPLNSPVRDTLQQSGPAHGCRPCRRKYLAKRQIMAAGPPHST